MLILVDVLNRFPLPSPPKSDGASQVAEVPPAVTTGTTNEDENLVRIMMYMFPRQFGLHNVFTSLVDRKQTAQQFQDYTLREEEINKRFPKQDALGKPLKVHIPKRLRGETQRLVQRLMVLHARCSYSELLQHCCPVSHLLLPTPLVLTCSDSRKDSQSSSSQSTRHPVSISCSLEIEITPEGNRKTQEGHPSCPQTFSPAAATRGTAIRDHCRTGHTPLKRFGLLSSCLVQDRPRRVLGPPRQRSPRAQQELLPPKRPPLHPPPLCCPQTARQWPPCWSGRRRPACW